MNKRGVKFSAVGEDFKKRGKNSSGKKRVVAFGEIFLLVSFSFALSFLIGESFGARVSADGGWIKVGDLNVWGGSGKAPGPAPGVNWPTPSVTNTPARVIRADPITNTQIDLTREAQIAVQRSTSEGTPPVNPGTPQTPVNPGAASSVIGQTVGGASIVPAGTQITAGSVIGPGSVLQSGTATLSNGAILQAGQAVPNSMTATIVGEGATMGGSGGSVAGAGSTLQTFTGNTAANTAGNTAASGGFLSNIFGGTAFGGGIPGALFSGLVWGAVAFGAGMLIGNLMGLSDKQSMSVAMGLGAGAFVGSSLYLYGQTTIAPTLTAGQALPFINTGFGALLIGAGIAAAIIILTYKKEKQELVKFECFAWEAPVGGSRCELCNEDPMKPCSLYRCKSLGQACELINVGSKNEQCVWISKGDTSAPHIEPDISALKPEGLRYDPDATISPPNRGFKINHPEGFDNCLPAFTKFTFGFTTDEPAQCKVDYTPSESYDKMRSFYVGNSNLFLTEHTQMMKTMNTEGEDGELVPEIGSDGTFTLWVRCIDANGNGQDAAMVAFRYCVDRGPDETAPIVTGTDIQTGSPVRFNVDSVPIELYTNEPAECKWSRQDKNFDTMENMMDCSKETYQINANLDYVCSGSLTGVENRQDNWFYFRCKDRKGNVMTRSHPLLLKGTQELTINSVGPTGEFTGSTSVIPVTLTVETAHGAEEGKAVCTFSTTPENAASFVAMDSTRSYTHNQSLDLSAGSYTFYFRCIDKGSNLAMSNTTFTVAVDTAAPRVTRIFRDANVLRVITDEDAKCYYSNVNCNYELNGSRTMSYENPTKKDSHSVEWNSQVTYYIKCEDMQGNQPRPDACQVIARASEL